VKVIQISDTHLFADDNKDIYGVKTNIKFEEVMVRIHEDIHDADVIFLTGDISQDETTESYEKILGHLSRLEIPVYWIPGNHDDPVQLQKVFFGANNFNRTASLSSTDWHFIFLDTRIEGRGDGWLSPTELNLLRNELLASPVAKKLAIIMHHHPAPVGTPLIDKYILQNVDDFCIIISDSRVELIICGHVHGDYKFKYRNIMIESSPATCLQWKKGTRDIIIENKIGYKIYHFDKRGYRSVARMW
jgi:Icc protein